jgi:hypothetical protein
MSEPSQFDDLRERAKALHEGRVAEDHRRREALERQERCRAAYHRLDLAISRMFEVVAEAQFTAG